MRLEAQELPAGRAADSRVKVRLVVDRRFELSQAAEAVRYLGHVHARKKIVVTV